MADEEYDRLAKEAREAHERAAQLADAVQARRDSSAPVPERIGLQPNPLPNTDQVKDVATLDPEKAKDFAKAAAREGAREVGVIPLLIVLVTLGSVSWIAYNVPSMFVSFIETGVNVETGQARAEREKQVYDLMRQNADVAQALTRMVDAQSKLIVGLADEATVAKLKDTLQNAAARPPLPARNQ